ncbi:MAG: hypothetical protein R3B70_07480 [Polyangiaceae bacterium]
MGRTGRIAYLGLISSALLALAATGCQDGNGTGTGGTAGDGGSNTGGNNTGGSTGGTNPGGGGTGGDTGGTTTTTTVNNDACETDVTDATVYQVTDIKADGAVGKDIKVRLNDVVAMSNKILISHSNNSGSCLWGVFVSAPKTADGSGDLTETAPYSGVIVLSYGPNAAQGTPCLNQAGAAAAGMQADADVIPDDIKPGDVVKVIGKTSKFIQQSCGQKATDSDVPQAQIFTPCKVEKTGGTAVVPAPHVLTSAEMDLMNKQKSADPGAKDFHEAWAGVRVRAADVNPIQYSGKTCGTNGDFYCCPMGVDMCTVEYFGSITLAEGNVLVPDSLYYVKPADVGGGELCHIAPVFPNDPVPSWSKVDGFHQLNFCTWVLAPTDKCADFDPQSEDCVAQGIQACFP